ncbi:MAG: translational GTPase TypA, partial [Desulfuromonadales bacterium]|nr:translational GTPase TypA [Desulfuromonadales bacterium]
EHQGTVIEKLGPRKAEMVAMNAMDGINRLEFIIPARGLIGFRNEFMTDTRGTGVLNHTFHGYAPFKGVIPGRKNGVLIALENGETVAYSLFTLQERGSMFVGPGVEVYTGMILGQNAKDNDLVINACKGKKLTNVRASGTDETIRLTPPLVPTLEQALEFIDIDELVEITPNSIRLRKRILDENDRKKDAKKQK